MQSSHTDEPPERAALLFSLQFWIQQVAFWVATGEPEKAIMATAYRDRVAGKLQAAHS